MAHLCTIWGFATGRSVPPANRLMRFGSQLQDSDGKKMDVIVAGCWDRPLDQAVGCPDGACAARISGMATDGHSCSGPADTSGCANS